MKKAVLLGLSALMLLIGAFFAIGIFVPSYQYTVSVDVARPLETAWDYFADESKSKDWIDGLKSMELIDGRPREAGAKFRMEFENDGRQIVMTETVSEYVPRQRIAFVLENESMRSENVVRFTRHGDATTIEQTTVVHGANPFWRSLFALMKPTFESNAERILAKLKSNIEAPSPLDFRDEPPIFRGRFRVPRYPRIR